MARPDLRRRAPRLSRSALTGRAWPLVAAVALAIVTWPLTTISPEIGIDPSWRVGLAVAFRDGMSWGDDLVFTYGPLGFLENPLVVSRLGVVLGLVWTLLLQVLVMLTVILATRRSFPWWFAVLVAWVVGLLSIINAEPLALLVFLWCAMAIRGDVGERLGRVLVPLAGVACGIAVLDKSNVGIVCIVMAAIAVPWLPPRGWRSLFVVAAAFAATCLVLWLALGQSVGNIAAWLRGSAEIASGFSAGFPFEDPERGWEYPAFAVGVAGLAFLVWRYGLPRERARALGLVGLAIVMGFAYFKHGFVRHDYAHSPYTFVVLMASPAAFAWRGAEGRRAGAAAFVVGAIVATVSLAQALGSPVDLLDPHDRVHTFATQVFDAVRPDGPAELRGRARVDIRDEVNVPPEMIRAIGDGTVHIDPYETAVAWAYDLRWRPVPVFQLYSAYTHELDRLDADAIDAGADDAPAWILRESVQRLDLRGRENEAPTYTIAMFCNYTEHMVSDGWQLLRRTPGRCGSVRDLGRREARAGDAVPVPSGDPGDLVFARFTIPSGPGHRLRAFLYKPRTLPVELLNDNYGTSFAEAVGPGDFLMRLPQELAFSDYSTGFGAGLLRLTAVGSPYTVTFHAVRMRPPDAPSQSVGD